MAEESLFKNILSPQLVRFMAKNLSANYPLFAERRFVKYIEPKLEILELKDRARLIADALHEFLPARFPEAAKVLIDSLVIDLEDESLGKYSSFYFLPYSEFIAKYGVGHFEEGMNACYELTKVFTAEFCIRPFIERYPDQALERLHQWTSDENHHVRRLVSEGSRSRLPWAGRLKNFQKDPTPVLALLEKLKKDPELYVRRSVANNLNDIAKDNPTLVMETLTRWKKSKDEGTQWIIRHASRTLIKDGHIEALLLQGFDPKAVVEVNDFKATDSVLFGEKLEFEFTLKNKETCAHDFVIDFVVYFKKANGKLAPKVFKLSEKSLKGGEELTIKKSHPIKPITTRTYYSGMQKLAIQVNGVERAEAEFELLKA